MVLKKMVGASGFEPPASWSRTRRASQAALRPDDTHSGACNERSEWNIQNSIAIRVSLECHGLLQFLGPSSFLCDPFVQILG